VWSESYPFNLINPSPTRICKNEFFVPRLGNSGELELLALGHSNQVDPIGPPSRTLDAIGGTDTSFEK
jgi:hypothetical protein